MLLKNDISSRQIDLSVRAVNALRKAGYNSLSECANIKLEELFNMENIGIKTANEIQDTLNSFMKKCNRRQLRKMTPPANYFDKRRHGYLVNLLAIPMAKIKLSVRAMHVLKKTKIRSLLELVQNDIGRIMQVRGCGVRTIREIKGFLVRLDLQPGRRPDNSLVRDVKKFIAEKKTKGILADFSRDYPDKYDYLTKAKAFNFTPARIKFYRDCYRAYRKLGTLERVGEPRNLTRERVRQILEQGTRLGLFNYVRKEHVCFSRKKIISDFSKHLHIQNVTRANGISEGHLKRMLDFHKITEKELEAVRLSTKKNRCIKYFRKIEAKLGYPPSTAELQKKKKTGSLSAKITRLWGSIDAFRKEQHIPKPAPWKGRKNGKVSVKSGRLH